MTPAALLIALTLLSVGAFWIGKSRSLALVGGSRGVRNLHSLPSHYGLMTALWCALPALAVIGRLARVPGRDHPAPGHRPPAGGRARSAGRTTCRWSSTTCAISWRATFRPRAVSEPVRAAAGRIPRAARHQPHGADRARDGDGHRRGASWFARASRRSCARAIAWRRVIEWLLIGCSTIAVFTTLGIVASVAFEAFRFFSIISPFDFLFGTVVEPADGDPRRPGGIVRLVRRGAAVRRHGADLLHRDGDRRAHRVVLGYLPGRIRASAASAPGPSRCSRCSPACRPSCTDSSRR